MRDPLALSDSPRADLAWIVRSVHGDLQLEGHVQVTASTPSCIACLAWLEPRLTTDGRFPAVENVAEVVAISTASLARLRERLP